MAAAGPIDTTLFAALLATKLPFVAFAVILLLTRSRPRLSAGLSLAAITVSLLSAGFLLVRHWGFSRPLEYSALWVASGDVTIRAGFLIDPLSLLMLAVVAAICFLVQVYSLGYMAGDPGFSRYYAFMSLFAWAMTNLTLAHTLLQLYIFWELVGLSSYLLIGFWYEKFSASEAGKKAFVMTRCGDVAFFLGVLLILLHLGNLNILELNGPAAGRLSPAVVTAGALLIFGGIIGKSAQFPLLTWLPDAMEGPTPVSALLHSATMVAAGVYLFARLFPFFSLSPTALAVCLAVGTVSMLIASTMAMVSRDIKQVWAYSTISQLGLMIMGLGAGNYVAGVFHLTTHAGFKALLFLCSGVFIHAFHSNDMVAIGRQGGRRLRVPMACLVVAAAALSGIPPFSGFFSKERILGALADLPNPLWVAAGLLGAFLTTYYTFRLIFIILFPAEGGPQTEPSGDTRHRHDGGYRVMALPLMVLAGVTVFLGFGEGAITRFLTAPLGAQPGASHHAWLPYAALGLCAAALLLAWFEFGRRGAAQVGFAERIAPLHALFSNRWYMDHAYRRLLDHVVYRVFSRLCARNDQKVIDGAVDGLGHATAAAGGLMSILHTGMVQVRLIVVFVSIVFMAIYFFI
ncbi:MAG: NADH-quinone oxidoreductase subunit L [Desulfobacterales bacterium]|jgi:NADH-quinone oxidoreductase subunit L|nr:NADH-quinone oxidoreductase subunit L [Desulfobacterales bacterium]